MLQLEFDGNNKKYKIKAIYDNVIYFQKLKKIYFPNLY